MAIDIDPRWDDMGLNSVKLHVFFFFNNIKFLTSHGKELVKTFPFMYQLIL